MTLSKSLLWSLFVVLISTAYRSNYSSADCTGFSFEAKVENNLSGDRTLTLKVTGGKKPYHSIVLNNKNVPVSKNFDLLVFERIPQGKYRCIVSDANDCTQEQLIDIK